MVFLGDLQSAAMLVLLVWAATLAVRELADPNNPVHRALILSISAVLALRYMYWRVTETVAPPGWTLDVLASWSFVGIEMLAMVGSLSSFVMLARRKSRTAEVDRHFQWWLKPEYGEPYLPKVAILIATYNEDIDVLERTIIGAKSLRYEGKTVYVLDDGKRDWLRDYCARIGVEYVTRPNNKGAKAGNINHTLQRSYLPR